ncbi:MAG TPA: hypothetical protein VN461_06335 [Vicinamibacteria bacterium]|jgi:hypothetical protein|nr:hypothetical protein [Vicinamibacteria bacterium]
MEAVVTLSTGRGRDTVDTEVRVRSLEELFGACRDAPPSRLVRISITGPEGEVRLNFASFRRTEGGR